MSARPSSVSGGSSHARRIGRVALFMAVFPWRTTMAKTRLEGGRLSTKRNPSVMNLIRQENVPSNQLVRFGMLLNVGGSSRVRLGPFLNDSLAADNHAIRQFFRRLPHAPCAQK